MVFHLTEKVGRSPHEVSAFCAEVGWPGLNVVQLEPGEMDVECHGVANYGYGMLGFKCRQSTFFTGPRNTNFQTFCMVDKPLANKNCFDFKDHGATFQHSTLVGMHSHKDHESFTMGASGRLYVAAIPWDAVHKYCKLLDKLGSPAGDQMQLAMGKFNELVLDFDWYQRLCAALRRRLFCPQPDPAGIDLDQLLALISQTISTGVVDTKTSRFCDSSHISSKIVEVAYSVDGTKILKLADLCEMLGYSDKTLQRDTDSQVGMGPMDLVRQVRMQQVRRALTDKPTHEALCDQYGGKVSVPAVFAHYRLSYSDRTRALYKTFHGRTPKQDSMESLR